MVELFLKGGLYIMIPLGILSIVSLAFILERLWRYYRVPRGSWAEQILAETEEHIRTGDIKRVVEYCQTHKNILTYVFLRLLDRFEFLVREKRSIPDMREELLTRAEEDTRSYLEEFVPVIHTVSTVAPLLGLLGTITGMIKSFEAISEFGVGDPQAVSKGISEALITTATGLTIAIPSILAYSFFRRRVEKLLDDLEPYENLFVNALLRDLARFRTYREMLKTAYRDGVLNEEEREFLRAKRVELNISDEEAAKLEKEVRQALGQVEPAEVST
jgi:biopolymer transport protein ExbB